MHSSRSSELKHDVKHGTNKMAWNKLNYRWTVPLFILHVIFFKPAIGNWSDWSKWSEEQCSVTCGGGTKTVSRNRYCNNANNDCVGDRTEKKHVECQHGRKCEDLLCYECNIFRNGKIVPCNVMTVQKRCRACMKSLTKITLHDRLGYTKDSVVESRLCVKHADFSEKTKEECEYHKNNGGISILCHCFSDKCNTGTRQGPSIGSLLFTLFVWKLFQ